MHENPTQGAQPPYPPPGYQPQQSHAQPSQHSAPARTSGLAVAALVIGLISLFLIPPLGLIGVIVGFLGIGSAKKTGAGKGMAIAGLIMSIIGIIVTAVLTVVIVMAGMFAFGVAKNVLTRERIESLSRSVETYKLTEGQLPATLEDAMKNGVQKETTDVWERKLEYKVTGETYRITSQGADIASTNDDIWYDSKEGWSPEAKKYEGEVKNENRWQ